MVGQTGFLPHGILAVLCAMISYGSYFVPVKRYEVYDGLVYQWYQCCGVFLAGILSAVFTNDWTRTTTSPGFYVCSEGLLSGLIFQLANITATRSVKFFGLGNYYTVHQVTNLGCTFIIGTFGPQLDLPTTPPRNVLLAAFGVLFLLMGMAPLTFMEKEMPPGFLPAAQTSEGNPANLVPVGEDGGKNHFDITFAPQTADSPQFRPDCPSVLRGSPSPEEKASEVPSSSMREVHIPVDRLHPPLAGIPNFRDSNAWTWDGTLSRPGPGEEPAWLLEPSSPVSFLGSAGLVVKEMPNRIEVERDYHSATGLDEHLLPGTGEAQPAGVGRWVQGFVLALLAGCLYACMYVPLLPWRRRMLRLGRHVETYDAFFAMCMGLYLASTAWLLCGSAWKMYRGLRVEKSVLRPALASGLIYAAACLSFLHAMKVVPYAVGYTLGCGGGLAVSLLWATLVFGEASSHFNRRCVACSFATIFVGIALLGLSA